VLNANFLSASYELIKLT